MEWEKKHRMHDLKLDSVTTNIECSCLLFEFRGILCCHSFLILDKKILNVFQRSMFYGVGLKMCEQDIAS